MKLPDTLPIPRWRATDEVRAKLASAADYAAMVAIVRHIDEQHNADFRDELKENRLAVVVPMLAKWVKSEVCDRMTQPNVDKAAEKARLAVELAGIDKQITEHAELVEFTEYATTDEQCAKWARDLTVPDAPPEPPAGKRGRKTKTDPLKGLAELLASF